MSIFVLFLVHWEDLVFFFLEKKNNTKPRAKIPLSSLLMLAVDYSIPKN